MTSPRASMTTPQQSNASVEREGKQAITITIAQLLPTRHATRLSGKATTVQATAKRLFNSRKYEIAFRSVEADKRLARKRIVVDIKATAPIINGNMQLIATTTGCLKTRSSNAVLAPFESLNK
ncbi:unnamed protein product [Ceratitis capitata]|uniref:(Mediterranean fruit fly) hypothetical protein n=1 Tax=Ceratitis capitata TaxID=7213 RepID=A0A811UK69_CERCA|nr:unnamed protein product [Ceratitis capitata]